MGGRTKNDAPDALMIFQAPLFFIIRLRSPSGKSAIHRVVEHFGAIRVYEEFNSPQRRRGAEKRWEFMTIR